MFSDKQKKTKEDFRRLRLYVAIAIDKKNLIYNHSDNSKITSRHIKNVKYYSYTKMCSKKSFFLYSIDGT